MPTSPHWSCPGVQDQLPYLLDVQLLDLVLYEDEKIDGWHRELRATRMAPTSFHSDHLVTSRAERTLLRPKHVPAERCLLQVSVV
jgi:hypothetical protein